MINHGVPTVVLGLSGPWSLWDSAGPIVQLNTLLQGP